MKSKTFYKQKYLIAIYNLDDDLIAVVDNYKELAEFMGKTVEQAQSALSRRFSPKPQLKSLAPIIIKKEKCRIYLIEADEQDKM